MNGDTKEVIGFNHTCAGVVDKGGEQHVVVVVRRVAMRRLVNLWHAYSRLLAS